MNDLEKAQRLLQNKDVRLIDLSKKYSLKYQTVRLYRSKIQNLKKASWETVYTLAKAYEDYLVDRLVTYAENGSHFVLATVRREFADSSSLTLLGNTVKVNNPGKYNLIPNYVGTIGSSSVPAKITEDSLENIDYYISFWKTNKDGKTSNEIFYVMNFKLKDLGGILKQKCQKTISDLLVSKTNC